MKLRKRIFEMTVMALALASLHARGQNENAPPPVPPAPPADTTPAAPGDQAAPQSDFDSWLLHPASSPVPAREDVQKFLGALQQRQQDLLRILSFLVDKKRLRNEQAAKESGAITLPGDVAIEHWDDLARNHQQGNLSDKDYAADVAAFAEKMKTVNTAQLALSHKCAQLMMQPLEETPKRRARSTPKPAPAEGDASLPGR